MTTESKEVHDLTPRHDIWTRIVRHLPWTTRPWESEEWQLGRWTRDGVWWYNSETGAEVHASKHLEPDENGWRVKATPDHDAPAERTFYPLLTPEPTTRETALYLAKQYMKEGVGLVEHENVESLNPPRIKSVEDCGQNPNR